MAESASTGGGGGMGVIAGILLAIVLIGAAVFAFSSGMFGSSSKKMDVNLNVNTPHLNTPSLPSAPSAPSTPSVPAPK